MIKACRAGATTPRVNAPSTRTRTRWETRHAARSARRRGGRHRERRACPRGGETRKGQRMTCGTGGGTPGARQQKAPGCTSSATFTKGCVWMASSPVVQRRKTATARMQHTDSQGGEGVCTFGKTTQRVQLRPKKERRKLENRLMFHSGLRTRSRSNGMVQAGALRVRNDAKLALNGSLASQQVHLNHESSSPFTRLNRHPRTPPGTSRRPLPALAWRRGERVVPPATQPLQTAPPWWTTGARARAPPALSAPQLPRRIRVGAAPAPSLGLPMMASPRAPFAHPPPHPPAPSYLGARPPWGACWAPPASQPGAGGARKRRSRCLHPATTPRPQPQRPPLPAPPRPAQRPSWRGTRRPPRPARAGRRCEKTPSPRVSRAPPGLPPPGRAAPPAFGRHGRAPRAAPPRPACARGRRRCARACGTAPRGRARSSR